MIHSLSRLGAFTAIAFAFAAPAAFAQSDDELLELGREVFLEHAEPACGLCHTLADAETEGGIGPILDDLQPSTDQVRLAVTLGVGQTISTPERLPERRQSNCGGMPISPGARQ